MKPSQVSRFSNIKDPKNLNEEMGEKEVDTKTKWKEND